MSNPFETPPSQPQRPAAETEREKPIDIPVPVPYTPAEMAAAKKRLDNDYLEPEAAPLTAAEQEQKEREGSESLRRAVELMDDFEEKYPLEVLHAITDIPLAELVQHPVRKPANIALVHIRKAFAGIPAGTNTTELSERWLRLSQAVGMYNSVTKTVDHDRG